MTISDVVVDLFEQIGDYGPLEHRPDQTLYAHLAATALQQGRREDTNMVLLEAEAGLGKTLGYAVPALLASIVQDRPIVVAAFTSQQRSQVAESFEMANELIEQIGFSRVAVEVYDSARDYFSPRRVANFYQSMTEEWSDDSRALLGHLTRRSQNDLVAIDEYCENGILVLTKNGVETPVLTDMLALRSTDRHRRFQERREHLGRSDGARIVLCTHVMAMRSRALRQEIRPYALIVDECHKLLTAGDVINSASVALSEVAETLTAVGGQKELLEKLSEVVAFLDRHYRQKRHNAMLLNPGLSREDYALLDQQLEHLYGGMEQLAGQLFNHSDPARRLLAVELTDYLDNLDIIMALYNPRNAYDVDITSSWPYVSWPDNRRDATIGVTSTQPGGLIGWAWRKTRADVSVDVLLLTTAYLYDERNFLRQIGIDASQLNRLGQSGPIRAKNYGSLDIILCPNSPDAIIGHDDVGDDSRTNYEAIRYWAEAITGAAGGSIVQCASHPDAVLLAQLLPEDRTVLQQVGDRTFVERFLSHPHPNRILVTVNWEGIDLPDAVDNVFQTRIPFAPEQGHLLAGLTEKNGPRAAYLGYIGRRLAAAVEQVYQGIHRGIRGPDEHCTIWFLDNRMPIPETIRLKSPRMGAKWVKEMLMAIPERFRQSSASQLVPPIDKCRFYVPARGVVEAHQLTPRDTIPVRAVSRIKRPAAINADTFVPEGTHLTRKNYKSQRAPYGPDSQTKQEARDYLVDTLAGHVARPENIFTLPGWFASDVDSFKKAFGGVVIHGAEISNYINARQRKVLNLDVKNDSVHNYLRRKHAALLDMAWLDYKNSPIVGYLQDVAEIGLKMNRTSILAVTFMDSLYWRVDDYVGELTGQRASAVTIGETMRLLLQRHHNRVVLDPLRPYRSQRNSAPMVLYVYRIGEPLGR